MRETYGANRVSLRLAFRPFVDMFQFRGRSTRTEVLSFWLLGLLSGLIHVVDVPPSTLTRVVGSAWSLLWTWPWIPLLARRLHDQDRSCWWIAVAFAFPVTFALEWLFMATNTGTGLSLSLDLGLVRETRRLVWSPISVVTMVAALFQIIATFLLFVWPNTDGPNRYGADPRSETRGNAQLAET